MGGAEPPIFVLREGDVVCKRYKYYKPTKVMPSVLYEAIKLCNDNMDECAKFCGGSTSNNMLLCNNGKRVWHGNFIVKDTAGNILIMSEGMFNRQFHELGDVYKGRESYRYIY